VGARRQGRPPDEMVSARPNPYGAMSIVATPCCVTRSRKVAMKYELRTYTAVPGKLDALLARFRDHTVELFARHNMESVGYWVSQSDPNVLIYVLRHTADPTASWASFREDVDWKAAFAASTIDGPLTTDVTSVYLEPTDFSALR